VYETNENGWWKGEINGKVSYIPSKFVTLLNGKSPILYAKYSYTSPDNLISFQFGDKIILLENSGEWIMGKNLTNGGTGYFPSSYVQEDLFQKGIVICDFEGQHEINVKMGQEVTVIEKLPKGWIFCSVEGKQGVIPESYISIYPSQDNQNNNVSIAKVDHLARSNFELSFSRGDNIVIDKKLSNEWYRGSFKKKMGLIPANKLDINRDEESIDKTKNQNERANVAQALVKLQAQTKISIDRLLIRIDPLDKERLKILSILQEVALAAQRESEKLRKYENINKKLSEEIKQVNQIEEDNLRNQINVLVKELQAEKESDIQLEKVIGELQGTYEQLINFAM